MAKFQDPAVADMGGDSPDMGDKTGGLLQDVTGIPSSKITPDVAANAGEMNFKDTGGIQAEQPDPTDFVHKIGAQLHDLGRVKSNVADMIRQGAPESDIDAYIKAEGTTPEAIKALDQKSIGKYVDDAARAIAHGITFGYADKIAAGLDAAMGRGTYEENLKKQREQTADIPALIRIPGEIAGNVASTVAAAPLAGAARLSQLPNIAKAVGGGALGGALYGSAESDGGAADKLKSAAVGAATGAATGGALYGIGGGIGKIVSSAGDKIMTSVIKPLKNEIEDGFSLDTIKKYGLGGSLRTTLSKTQDLMNSITGELRSKLAASDAKINLNEVYDQTQNTLLGENKLKSFGANTKIQSALDGLAKEISSVSSGELSIPNAQIVKQAAGHFGAWQYGRPDPESKASEIVYNTFYNHLKTAIENNSPEGVKELNQQLSKLIPVSNAVIRRLPVSDRNNIISLPEWIGLAASVSHPGALGLTGLSLLSRSGAAGNAMSKFGAGMQERALTPSIVGGSLSGLALQRTAPFSEAPEGYGFYGPPTQ